MSSQFHSIEYDRVVVCVSLTLTAALGVLGVFGILPAFWSLACLVFVALAACIYHALAAGNLIDLLRDNATTAESLARGEYKSCFRTSGSGAAFEAQMSLGKMLAKFKKDHSLARGIMKSMDTPCVVVDREENFIFGNAGLIKMLEHTGRPEDYYGQNVAYFFYGDASRPTVLGTAMRENKFTKKEVEFTGRKGTKLNIHIDASPLDDLDGNLMGALCVYTDLTEVRHSEARLKAQNEKISDAVDNIDAVSVLLNTTAESLNESVRQAEGISCVQAERATETSNSMNEINAVIVEISKNASLASTHSETTKARAQSGAEVVDRAVVAISNAAKLSNELKANLSQLGHRAEEIGNIMNVISDIADQTNLLALNAAIEAARAGDAGRGFAVVADEVRKLAEKTMGATKEVGQAIATIQSSTKSNLEGMDKVSLAVEESSRLAGLSGKELREIVALILQTSDQIACIATATEEQSAASEHIAHSVAEVRNSCDETSLSMSDASKNVRELEKLAHQLRDIIKAITR